VISELHPTPSLARYNELIAKIQRKRDIREKTKSALLLLNPTHSVKIRVTLLEYLLELLLLRTRQAVRELDLDAHHEIAPVVGFLGLGHAEVGVPLCPGRP
jgi:hypothetical protein